MLFNKICPNYKEWEYNEIHKLELNILYKIIKY